MKITKIIYTPCTSEEKRPVVTDTKEANLKLICDLIGLKPTSPQFPTNS